ETARIARVPRIDHPMKLVFRASLALDRRGFRHEVVGGRGEELDVPTHRATLASVAVEETSRDMRSIFAVDAHAPRVARPPGIIRAIRARRLLFLCVALPLAALDDWQLQRAFALEIEIAHMDRDGRLRPLVDRRREEAHEPGGPGVELRGRVLGEDRRQRLRDLVARHLLTR